jgi:predicted cupin superfamily sugar epimerase
LSRLLLESPEARHALTHAARHRRSGLGAAAGEKGAPLVITVSANGHDAEAHHLGPELRLKQRPQIIVPAGCWQTATSLGHWTLAGCTVAPGFSFEGFEMAPPGWRPTPRR